MGLTPQQGVGLHLEFGGVYYILDVGISAAMVVCIILLQGESGFHRGYGSRLYCVSHISAGNHVFNGDTLYCVLHFHFGCQVFAGSTIVEVRQGVSPFHALTHDSYKHS